jgi:hypothetical protein
MEDLFVPTARFRDMNCAAREREDDEDDTEEEMNRLVELELITGSSVEDTFLHCGFSWNDFYSWAHEKIVWIRPDVFFDFTKNVTGFQTVYQRFLTVYIVPNEEDLLHVYARSEA